jgi:hypothetical protein
MSEEGFFSRWSRRKQGLEASEADKAPEPSAPAAAQGADAPAAAAADAAPPQALPTLQDAQALTPESDFQPFMQSGVGAEVRNAAMKKLFTDPHFNVMDGLDIYIEDYNLPDPMPAGMLQKMASAQFLKLVPPEEAKASASEGSELVAQSPGTLATAETPSHDHPDLQLQPDPSPAEPSAEPDAR